jgi:hypothetical protein
MGVGISFALLFDPTMLFPQATAADPILTSWVVRNLATALVLLITAGSRRADWLLVGFLGRALTESGDAVLAITSGNLAGLGVPLVMLAADAAAMSALWKVSKSPT